MTADNGIDEHTYTLANRRSFPEGRSPLMPPPLFKPPAFACRYENVRPFTTSHDQLYEQ